MKYQFLLVFALLSGMFLFTQPASAQGTTGPMSGRITKSSGIGLMNVSISIQPSGYCFNWTRTIARTNGFGYYNAVVHTDCELIVVPSYKFYNFTPNARVLNYGDSLENVDFVGEPPS